MKRLFAVAALAGMMLPASAQSSGSWIDEVLPAGATTPYAVGEHNCLQAYPEAAKQARIEGITSVSFHITEQGVVQNVKLRQSSGDKTLDKAAVACIKGWLYTPAKLDDKPIAVDWRYDVKWVIDVFATGPIITVQVPASPPANTITVQRVPSNPPPVNTITTQSPGSAPPPISSPASIGRPHVCSSEYPRDAIAEHAQGTVMIGFTITTEGSVDNIHIVKSSGNASLDDAAIRCSGTWRYKPAIKNSVPIAVPWKAEVRWSLT